MRIAKEFSKLETSFFSHKGQNDIVVFNKCLKVNAFDS